MDNASEDCNLYAPPGSYSTTTLGPPPLGFRFWSTCVAFALATPWLLYGAYFVSAWSRVVIAFILWCGGACWILLPHLMHRNRSELDPTHMACIAIGFPACAGLLCLGIAMGCALVVLMVSFVA